MNADQDICLWVVGGGAAFRDRVGDRAEFGSAPLSAVGRMAPDRDARFFREAEFAHVVGIEKQNAALASDAAVAVAAVVDRGVVLVVRPQGHQAQVAGLHVNAGQGVGNKVRPSGGSAPLAVGGRIWQMEPAGLLDSLVVIREARDDRFDAVADTVVVRNEGVPIHRPVREKFGADPGNDGGFGLEVFRRRAVDARGGVDHAHRVFDRHRLPPSGLDVGLRAAEAGEDQRGLTIDDMAAVQVGRDMDRHAAPAQCLPSEVGVGSGRGEIPAHSEEKSHASLGHGLDGVDGRVAVMAWRGEAEFLFQTGEKFLLGFLGDAHGAVTLDIAVSANGARPGTRAADVSAQQQEVHHLLNVRHAVAVLGEAHRPAANHRARAEIDLRRFFNLLAVESALLEKNLPRSFRDEAAILLESVRVPLEKIVIENRAVGLRFFQNEFRHRADGGHVASDLHLVVMRADRRAAAEEHVDGILRMREIQQTRFLKRIETHDSRAALRGFLELGEHARVVGARILTKHKNRVGLFKILERHGALAGGERFVHPDTTRLMAHVRAVGEIVRPEKPTEQLVEERRLVASAAGGVERRLVGRAERAQVPRDAVERLVPRNRLVAVGIGIVGHRVREPSGVLEREVIPSAHLGDGVFRKKLGRRALGGRFVGQGFDAILAEFRGRRIFRIRPGAAGAIEAARLVHAEEGRVAFEETFAAEEVQGGIESSPSAGFGFLFSHGLCWVSLRTGRRQILG
jgi:hypothetical protein